MKPRPATVIGTTRRLTAYATTAFLARTGVEAIPPTLLLAALVSQRAALDGAFILATATASAVVGGPLIGTVLDAVRRPAWAYALVLSVTCLGLAGLASLISWAPLPLLMGVAVLVGIGQPALSGALTAQLGRIVPPPGLPRALSVDVGVFSVAGMAGPALAGLGVALAASGQLLLAAAPFGLALLALHGIRLPRRTRTADRPRHSVVSGIRALMSDRVLREVTIVTSFTAVGQAGVVVAAPLLSRELTGGLGWTGVLLTTLAAGNLAASVVTARWPLRSPPERVVRVAAAAYTIVLCLLAVVPGAALTLLTLFVLGAITALLVAALFLSRFQRSPGHLQGGVFGTAAGLRSLSFAAGAAVLGAIAPHNLSWCLLAAGLAQLIGMLLGAVFAAPHRPRARGRQANASPALAVHRPVIERTPPMSTLPLERPGKIIAVGLNYRDHAAEADTAAPSAPVLFTKWSSCLVADGDPIVIPDGVREVDWEAELAVVIGRTARSVAIDEALDYVRGYTALNDVTDRAAQAAEGQWSRAKSYDTFGPIGPRVVPAAEIGDPQRLAITARLNGETVQSSNTALMIHSVASLISFISSTITLEPGDVITTGTPAGVGAFRDPPIFLKPGDSIVIEVEGIGTLSNPVRAA
ncbi:MFS transporter [Asanoa sp. NPDC049573]|uniref:MFS transporter n=1 Tax=Asanoa sp. NPDC049573 TaxID=3155396 RepID=UPI00343FA883